jgi:hypothetical protein
MRSFGVHVVTGREKKRADWGAGRQALLGLASEVFAGLERSASRRKVYEKFKDRLGMSYSQFCYWVKRYRQEAEQTAKARSLDAPAAHLTPSRASAAPAVPLDGHKPLYLGPSEQRTFHYDPMDAYRKKYD